MPSTASGRRRPAVGAPSPPRAARRGGWCRCRRRRRRSIRVRAPRRCLVGVRRSRRLRAAAATVCAMAGRFSRVVAAVQGRMGAAYTPHVCVGESPRGADSPQDSKQVAQPHMRRDIRLNIVVLTCNIVHRARPLATGQTSRHALQEHAGSRPPHAALQASSSSIMPSITLQPLLPEFAAEASRPKACQQLASGAWSRRPRASRSTCRRNRDGRRDKARKASSPDNRRTHRRRRRTANG